MSVASKRHVPDIEAVLVRRHDNGGEYWDFDFHLSLPLIEELQRLSVFVV